MIKDLLAYSLDLGKPLLIEEIGYRFCNFPGECSLAYDNEKEKYYSQLFSGLRKENLILGNNFGVIIWDLGVEDGLVVSKQLTPKTWELLKERFRKTTTEQTSLCKKCGEGVFNICDREECENIGNCNFIPNPIFIGGKCE